MSWVSGNIIRIYRRNLGKILNLSNFAGYLSECSAHQQYTRMWPDHFESFKTVWVIFFVSQLLWTDFSQCGSSWCVNSFSFTTNIKIAKFYKQSMIHEECVTYKQCVITCSCINFVDFALWVFKNCFVITVSFSDSSIIGFFFFFFLGGGGGG